jgi:hypothetical protein
LCAGAMVHWRGYTLHTSDLVTTGCVSLVMLVMAQVVRRGSMSIIVKGLTTNADQTSVCVAHCCWFSLYYRHSNLLSSISSHWESCPYFWESYSKRYFPKGISVVKDWKGLGTYRLNQPICGTYRLVQPICPQSLSILYRLVQPICPQSLSILYNRNTLSRGSPAPFHYPPPHLKRPRLRNTKSRVKRKKGGRQEKKYLLRYTDYSEQEENDGLHHTSPTHNKKSTIHQAVRKWTILANNV